MLIERLVVGELQTNCYILADEEGAAAVIDPGGDVAQIEDAITERGLNLQRILLTHGHPDHVFAAGKLQQIKELDLVMHRADADQISGNLEIAALFYDMNQYIPPKPTTFVEDGDTVNVGMLGLRVLHTPGHTPGGVCYLQDSAVFVGDTLFAGSIGRTDLPGGDYNTLLDSIRKKLLVLKDETVVYPGHGGVTTIGAEKQFNPFLA